MSAILMAQGKPGKAGQHVPVVDGEDNQVDVETRGTVLEEGYNFRTAHVLLFNETNEVLLQYLGERARNPDRYGSSAATWVREGESYEEAAGRALETELGVSDAAGGLFFLFKTRMREPDAGGAWKFVAVYGIQYTGELVVQDPAVDSVTFVSPEAVARLLEEAGNVTPTGEHVLTVFADRVAENIGAWC